MAKKYALLFLVLFTSVGEIHAQPLRHIPYGQYAVGFKSSLQSDCSRPSRNKTQPCRMVQVNVWYPAKEKRSTPIHFAEYIYLEGQEDSLVANNQKNQPAVKNFLQYPESVHADMKSWNDFLTSNKPMKAQKALEFKKGNYPVVQLIHGSAATFAFLGEYLASHGMVVINVPYKGYLQNSFDVNAVGMETEIRDQEFAFDHVVKTFGLKSTKVGLVGYSFGGQSAVGMAVRQQNVKAIVSLDGGIGSAFGPYLLSDFKFYEPEKLTMPILHLYNSIDPGTNLDWLQHIEFNDRYLVPFNNMDHSFFGSFGILDNEINNVLGRSMPRPGTNGEAILLYTLTFLEEVFGDRNEIKVMGLQHKNTWMSNVDSVMFIKKKFESLPLTHWKTIIQEKGIDSFVEQVKNQRSKIGLPVTDASYRSLFLDAFGNRNKDITLKLAQSYKVDFPNSALAEYYIGRSQQLNEREDLAKEHFEACLDMLKDDQTLTIAEKETIEQRATGFLKK